MYVLYGICEHEREHASYTVLYIIGLLNAQPEGIQQQSDHSSVQDQHFEGKTLLMVNVFGVRYCIGMGLPHVATTQWSRKLPLLSPDLSLCAFITNASTQQLHYSQSGIGSVGPYS